MGGRARELGPALLAGLAALWVYARTLAPTITWAHASGDGGDLITAVCTQGVPHPTGYPTYLLLGSLFAALAPGDPAYRLNLMSAVAAAGATALLADAVVRLSQRRGGAAGPARVAGLTAGLALAFSPVFWSQAVVAEVYTLHALFFAALVWLTGAAPGESVAPLALGLVWGLGLGNHLTLLLASPVIALATARIAKDGQRGRRAWLELGAGLALGLAVYLALPLRASAGPVINWGDPRTPAGLWWLVSGELYRSYVLALPLVYWPARLSAWAGLIGGQLTWAGLAAALAGVAWLGRRDPGLALAGGATFGLVSLFALGYNTTDSYVLLIPAFVLLALWAGFGWAGILARLWRRGKWTAGMAAALGLAVPLWLLASGYGAADASQDRAAVDFGRGVFEAAPSRAVLVSHSDLHSFVLWYYRYVLGARPDVAVVDADLLDYAWYVEALARHEPDLNLEDLSSEMPQRPVCRIEGDVAGWRLQCRPDSTRGVIRVGKS